MGTKLGTTGNNHAIKQEMAYPPGMELHGSQWRVNKRVPLDLIRKYPQYYPKGFLRFNTGESDKQLAAVKAWAWLAEREQEFQRVRETGSPYERKLPDEAAERIIRAAIHSSLKADEETRAEGLDDLMFERIGEWTEEAKRREQDVIARGRLSPGAVELAQEWLFGHGYDLEEDSPEFRQFAVRLFRRLSEATKIAERRNAGEWVETPPPPESPPSDLLLHGSKPASASSGHRLSDVLPIWQRLKNPARSSVEIYEAAINRFEGRYPDLAVEGIEKRHIREYVAWLQELGKSAKTIEKEHGVIRAMLAIAEHEEWIQYNPARGILLPEVKGKKVRSYTPDECGTIFASDVFTKGERPVGGKGDAAHWIPLLMLFTGARREEIAQLTAERLRFEEGVAYLAIDPIDDDGRLKTDESKRSVPVHPQLIRMGFLDYVAKRRDAGGGMLFPLLKPNKRGQYAAKWGDWWRRYVREKIGITDERISPSHSFRHLFITECRRLGFREDYERALVGHVRGSRVDAHDGYGEHLVPALAAELNRIDFRGLDLRHLWKEGARQEAVAQESPRTVVESGAEEGEIAPSHY